MYTVRKELLRMLNGGKETSLRRRTGVAKSPNGQQASMLSPRWLKSTPFPLLYTSLLLPTANEGGNRVSTIGSTRLKEPL